MVIEIATWQTYVETPCIVIELGIPGPRGAPGSASADLRYTHTQAVPDATWTVNHHLGKLPSVTVVDSSGREVEGDVQHLSTNQLTIEFSGPFAGAAYCN